MKKSTKVILGFSIFFAVVLIALIIILVIVKVKDKKDKPEAIVSTESIESNGGIEDSDDYDKVKISFNRDSLDEFGKAYYDNIYDCAYMTFSCNYSGDCFFDDEYFSKANANVNTEELLLMGEICPKYVGITFRNMDMFGIMDNNFSVYACNKGVYFSLNHLANIYMYSKDNTYLSPFGTTDKHLLHIDNGNYNSFDIKGMVLEAILNSDYTLGTVENNPAVNIKGGLKSSYDNYVGRFLNENFNEDMVITIKTEGEFGNRDTILYCEGQTYSFEIFIQETSISVNNTFDTKLTDYTVFEENELDRYVAEIDAVFGEGLFDFLDY